MNLRPSRFANRARRLPRAAQVCIGPAQTHCKPVFGVRSSGPVSTCESCCVVQLLYEGAVANPNRAFLPAHPHESLRCSPTNVALSGGSCGGR